MDISLSSLLRSPLESFLLYRQTDLMRGGCTRAGSLRLRFFLKCVQQTMHWNMPPW